MCICIVYTESPLQFYVNRASTPSVTASGPGLVYGVANKMAAFTIFTQDAAEGTNDMTNTARIVLIMTITARIVLIMTNTALIVLIMTNTARIVLIMTNTAIIVLIMTNVARILYISH